MRYDFMIDFMDPGVSRLSDVSFTGKDQIHDRKEQAQGESEKKSDLPVESAPAVSQKIVNENGYRINYKGHRK
jgi:hypothetical protein